MPVPSIFSARDEARVDPRNLLSSIGEVVYAGPGKTDDHGKLIAMGVKPGDKVLFGKYSGQEFKLEGQDLLHMREDDVIGIVD